MWERMGFFARFDEGELITLDSRGKASTEYGASTGLIQATQSPWNSKGLGVCENVVWMITGTNAEGVGNAVNTILNQSNDMQHLFAAAIVQGEVIGIVSHILTETGGFQGIGFVVSSNVAKSLFIDQKAFWSGFESVYITDEMAALFNLPQNAGLMVTRVVINSPAHDMGLKGGTIQATINDEDLLLGGDIILAVNGIRADVEKSF